MPKLEELRKQFTEEFNDFDLYGKSDLIRDYIDVDFYIYENDEYGLETVFGTDVEEALRSAFYGDYKYMDAYFILNGYGNIETKNTYEADELVDSYLEEYITFRLDELGFTDDEE